MEFTIFKTEHIRTFEYFVQLKISDNKILYFINGVRKFDGNIDYIRLYLTKSNNMLDAYEMITSGVSKRIILLDFKGLYAVCFKIFYYLLVSEKTLSDCSSFDVEKNDCYKLYSIDCDVENSEKFHRIGRLFREMNEIID